jgi:hypothetical protein
MNVTLHKTEREELAEVPNSALYTPKLQQADAGRQSNTSHSLTERTQHDVCAVCLSAITNSRCLQKQRSVRRGQRAHIDDSLPGIIQGLQNRLSKVPAFKHRIFHAYHLFLYKPGDEKLCKIMCQCLCLHTNRRPVPRLKCSKGSRFKRDLLLNIFRWLKVQQTSDEETPSRETLRRV